MSLFAELNRRNVLRVGAFYVVASWLVLQVGQLLFEVLGVPDWGLKLVLGFALLGFPIALICSWIFEVTAEGIKRESEIDRDQSITDETGKRLDLMTIVLLLGVAGLFLIDKLVHPTFSDHSPEMAITPPDPADGPRDEGGGFESGVPLAPNPVQKRSVAVLPFVAMSNGEDDEFFADGLTGEILNALTHLPGLLVTARTSAFKFKSTNEEIPEIARQLGVAHVVEGSVRRAGDQLRITAQLIRASDGFHLWSDSYDRTTDDIFAVQEDIASNVAQALDVVMDEAQRTKMRNAGIRNVQAFIHFQKGYALYMAAHDGSPRIPTLRQANVHFEQTMALAPEFGDAYYHHSDFFSHIVLEMAEGIRSPGVTDEDIKTAPRRLLDDFNSAVQLAHGPRQRSRAMVSRSLMSEDWHGILQNLEHGLDSDGCGSSFWLYMISPFGKTQEIADFFRRLATCDPFSVPDWENSAVISLWAGAKDEALERIGLGLKHNDGSESLEMFRIKLLIAMDRPTQAEELFRARIKDDKAIAELAVFFAAIKGETEEARTLSVYWTEQFGTNELPMVIFAAWAGNRQKANTLAAVIDSRVLGPSVLARAVYFCLCGAPFDIESTPNFRKRLEEGGLTWPPPTPIQFPAKDW